MKNKTFQRVLTLALTLALCWGGISSASAVETGTLPPLPDSMLYYGRVETILRDEEGTVTGLHMTSERYGEYVMRLTGDTLWIDSGNRVADDPADLKEGEGLYVFHSSVSTRSMPPQSAAFAIVRNIPQDAGCAQYLKVEAVEEKEGVLHITTNGGALVLLADETTGLSAYEGEAPEGFDAIKAGDHIMAWYNAMNKSEDGQVRAGHIMTLDRAEEPLTRAGFAVMLHEAQGSPVANYFMNFSDVAQDAPYAEAIRWAASEKLMAGYGDGTMGPEDALTREQLVVILWLRAGSPRLMDYPGLTNYEDVRDISIFAQSAMAWAHQKGLVPAGGHLGPQESVTLAEVQGMLEALNK